MPKTIDCLIQGYQEFRSRYFTDATVFDKLVQEGQRPKTLVIACSDSRVDPAIVLNCEPGDLFVIRNVANLIPPYENDNNTYHGTSAALEFGICMLEIRHVIVFGHTQCGGIRALMESSHESLEDKSFITKWVELAQPAQKVVRENHAELGLEQQVDLCGKYAIIHSLKNLQTFPWIRQRVDSGQLSLHAWYFDLAKGLITAFDEEKNCFTELLL
ncbi:MAG: carbonic anhydrase [Alphaproteobacteria bacterium]